MSWVDVLVGAGGGATAVGIIGAFLVRQIRHAVARVVRSEVTGDLEAVKNNITEQIGSVKDDITELHLKLTKEMGGNSNGLRQAVNQISRDIVTVGKDVAHLKGAFEQHTHNSA